MARIRDAAAHLHAYKISEKYSNILIRLIFLTVCSGIDWFRGRFIEPWLMKASTTGLHRLRPRPRPTGT